VISVKVLFIIGYLEDFVKQWIFSNCSSFE